MLLLDMAWREGAMRPAGAAGVLADGARARRASSLRNGPRTSQDRWEENAGYTPFTLAVQIAALLAAADLAEACDIEGVADFLRDTADAWNEQIEDWIYVDGHAARARGRRARAITSASRPKCPARRAPNCTALVEVRNRFGGSGAMSRRTN